MVGAAFVLCLRRQIALSTAFRARAKKKKKQPFSPLMRTDSELMRTDGELMANGWRTDGELMANGWRRDGELIAH